MDEPKAHRPAEERLASLELLITIDAWRPLRGRLRARGPGPRLERDFVGWSGLAAALVAMEPDGVRRSP